jgi:hypothetical protein
MVSTSVCDHICAYCDALPSGRWILGSDPVMGPQYAAIGRWHIGPAPAFAIELREPRRQCVEHLVAHIPHLVSGTDSTRQASLYRARATSHRTRKAPTASQTELRPALNDDLGLSIELDGVMILPMQVAEKAVFPT